MIEPILEQDEFRKAVDDWCYQSGGKDLGVFMWNRAVNLMASKKALAALSAEEVERTWQFLHDEEGNAPNHQDFAQALFREASLKVSKQALRSPIKNIETVGTLGRAGELSELRDGLENAEKLVWLRANLTNKNRSIEEVARIHRETVIALAPRITELTNLAERQEALHALQIQSLQEELDAVSAELNRMRDMF